MAEVAEGAEKAGGGGEGIEPQSTQRRQKTEKGDQDTPPPSRFRRATSPAPPKPGEERRCGWAVNTDGYLGVGIVYEHRCDRDRVGGGRGYR